MIDAMALLKTSAILRGRNVGAREMFEAVSAAIMLHGRHPVISRTYAFQDATAALLDLTGGEHVGKIVINVPAIAG